MISQNLSISSEQINQHPYETFAWMRENEPVYRAKLRRNLDAYLITRYEDVDKLLLDQELLIKNLRNAKTESGKSSPTWVPKTFRPLMHNMLTTDEPDHRRLRNLVHKGFAPRIIMNLQPRIEQIADDLLHKMKGNRDNDLVEQYAKPLPIIVITEMMGIPTEDRAQFRQWTEKILVNPTPLNMAKASFSVRAFLRYMRKLVIERRNNPQDDLISALVLAQEDNESLTEDEIIGTVFLLLVAGHETTIGLIANGTRALLTHPDQFELLKHDHTLMASTIEEMLRWDGPLQTTEQAFAKQTFTLHGVTIPKGATILPAIISANRDETVFTEANHFNIQRTPNKHLAFGKGIHYCLGASLARLEAKIAFGKLMEHSSNLRLAVPASDLRYSDMMMINRTERLPVLF